MQKWEYIAGQVDKSVNTEVRKMDALGSKGWELVSVDNGMAYFKRPFPAPIACEKIYAYDADGNRHQIE